MRKGVLLTVAGVLLLSSTAFALVGQLQDASVGSAMLVGRTGGAGSATDGVILTFGQNQYDYDKASRTTAFQTQGGLIAQGATAVGKGGMSGVTQGVGASAKQGQLAVGPLTIQGEKMEVGLGQTAVKQSGIGGAQGFQAFIGGQSQIVSSPTGVSAQGQTVAATQYSAVSGGPCSNAIATSQVGVELTQGQLSVASCKPKPPCPPPPCPPPPCPPPPCPPPCGP